MKPLFALLVLSTTAIAGDTFDDMLLRDGTVLKNVEVLEITDRGLKVKHNDGTGLIKTDQLPAEVKKRYGARIEAAAKAAPPKEAPPAPPAPDTAPPPLLPPPVAPEKQQPGAPAAPATIPGLKPADAVQLCGKMGLVARARPAKLGREWICSPKDGEGDTAIVIAALDEDSLTRITGTVTDAAEEPGRTRAQKVFSELASLAYTGADPVKAKQWITDNLGADDAKTTISGVTFHIKAGTTNSRSRMLRIACP